MRWCGTCARIADEGLALPMSSPRYTWAESTLTISSGNLRASASATSVLPVPVGPVSTAMGRVVPGKESREIFTSTAAQEHAVELRQRHLRPRRSPVVALIGARRLFHLAQQRVHL